MLSSLTKKPNVSHQDFMASIVVFLVALPLCLGIAVASGAPPISGLIGGIIGGIVVGMFGGSPMQVSGPANGLIVVSFVFIASHSFELLLWATLLAGFIQFLAGTLRFGQLFRAVTPGVILGLMLGFAIVIFFGQAHVMMGSDPVGSTWQNFLNLREVLTYEWLSGNHGPTALIGLVTIASIFGYEKFAPKKLKFLPAALVAVIVGTLTAQFTGSHAARIDIPASLASSITLIDITQWQKMFSFDVIEVALLIAFIASAETLLCCTAVDKLHNGPRTKYNKELSAQGIGNMLCGALGGLPITGVIIRSSANVAAGGKTKYATIMHGVWLLAAIVLLGPLLSEIPLAVLAGVLIHAVTKLVKPSQIKELWNQDRFGVVVFIATTLGIVFFGVLEGVVTGLVLSAARLLKTFNQLDVLVTPSESKKTQIKFLGSATFLRIPYIAGQLEQVKKGAKVEFDTDSLIHLDYSVYNLIHDWEAQHKSTGGEVVPSIESIVKKIGTNKLDFKKDTDVLDGKKVYLA